MHQEKTLALAFIYIGAAVGTIHGLLSNMEPEPLISHRYEQDLTPSTSGHQYISSGTWRYHLDADAIIFPFSWSPEIANLYTDKIRMFLFCAIDSSPNLTDRRHTVQYMA